MAPRAATASRTRPVVASSSSSSRTKATSTRPPRGRGRTESAIEDASEEEYEEVDDQNQHSSRTNGSITGPILLDDDEEDELALRSPIKIVAAPTVKPKAKTKADKLGSSSSSASSALSKARTVFGKAQEVTNLKNSRRDQELLEEMGHTYDNDIDAAPSRPVSTGPLKGRNTRTNKGNAKSQRIPTKAKRPPALVDSSEEEVDADDDEGTEEGEQSGPMPRRVDGVSMPEEQIQHFLHGYDLDAANRVDRLRNHLAVTLESARSQMSIILSRLPMAARSLPLREFLELHDADVRKIVGGAGMSAVGQVYDDDADGWEEMKKKRPRAREGEGDEADKDKMRRGKTARRNGTVSSPAKPVTLDRELPGKRIDKKSIPLTGRPIASSGPPAPSLATFSPRLNSTTQTLPSKSNAAAATALAKTPARSGAVAGRASRLAKIGEQIQMYSLNGSPITGFIGPDGRLRYLPRGGPVDDDVDEEEQGEQGAIRGPETAFEHSAKALGNKNSATSTQDANHSANSTEKALATILSKVGDASSSRLPPSSPAPRRPSSSLGRGTGMTSRFDDLPSSSAVPSSPLRPPSRSSDGKGQGTGTSSSLGRALEALTMVDDSNELPDEEAYMQEIMAQEEQRRRDREAATRSAGPSTTAANNLQHKSSASRLMAKFSGGGGASGSSSNPPSSPAPSSSSFSSRSGGFRSSPSKAPQAGRGGGGGAGGNLLHKAVSSASLKSTSGKKVAAPALGTPAASATQTSGSGQRGAANKQRLSLINARGEVVPIEDIREEDVPVEQKAQLARMFQRLGMGFGLGGGSGSGSPKKR